MQGREAVPDTVDHVLVAVDPKADRSWLQSSPEVPSDNVHAFDSTGTSVDTPENWSFAVKRLKPRVLQRLIDAYKCAALVPLRRSLHSRVCSSGKGQGPISGCTI